MFDILSGGILGSLFGGLFRLAPEVLKFMDKKNERNHELSMWEHQCQLEAQRGAQKLSEIGAQREAAVDVGAMDALNAAISQQAEMSKAAGGWSASLSASVRPVVTYWIIFLWSIAQAWFMVTSISSGLAPADAFKQIMSPDFMALISGTINYWFLDRTLKARGL